MTEPGTVDLPAHDRWRMGPAESGHARRVPELIPPTVLVRESYLEGERAMCLAALTARHAYSPPQTPITR